MKGRQFPGLNKTGPLTAWDRSNLAYLHQAESLEGKEFTRSIELVIYADRNAPLFLWGVVGVVTVFHLVTKGALLCWGSVLIRFAFRTLVMMEVIPARTARAEVTNLLDTIAGNACFHARRTS